MRTVPAIDDPRIAFSSFVRDVLTRYPEQAVSIWDDELDTTPLLEQLPELGESQILRELRIFRHVHLARIAWLDISGQITTEQVLVAVSDLAEAVIGLATRWSVANMGKLGIARDREGSAVDPIVFGLGKLGGRELNFSSDIDLVYAYRSAGESDGQRSVANEVYFTRLVQKLTHLLGHTTEDGFCYRVDLRLRPFGDAGRVALSANAMEMYFGREGRDWERYAWIKGRVVGGSVADGDQILRALRPFIYRRYLDYNVFDSLAEMKAMIRAEVQRKNLKDHIKLGEGGIREVEFIAQAFQLLRGGRERALRSRRLLKVLPVLAELGLLSDEQSDMLRANYLALRAMENRFQQVADAQTHTPPDSEQVREQIAWSLGDASWSAAWDRINVARNEISELFDELFQFDGPGENPLAVARWRDPSGESDLDQLLRRYRSGTDLKSLGERARARLDRLVAKLIEDYERRQDLALVDSVLEILMCVARRSTYLALMAQHDEVLDHLIEQCAASPWLASQLVRHPLLLDDLIDRRRPQREDPIADRVASRLADAAGDMEAEMNVLREILIGRRFLIANRFLAGAIAAGDVVKMLTEMAEAIVTACCDLAWRDLRERHGTPPGGAGSLTVLAYGTLGARNLGFASDLDLVFLYDGARADDMTEGTKPVAVQVFFGRLAQRVLHYLTTVTTLGRLYEVDTRLRPNGRSGLMVTRFNSFADYQQDKAWCWEHQALSRARVIYGTEDSVSRFENLRREILTRSRDANELRTSVVEMRDKMLSEFPGAKDGLQHLKHGRGGRVDLDFLVQYAVLRHSNELPDLAGEYDLRQWATLLEQVGKLPVSSEAVLEADRWLRREILMAALQQTRLWRDPTTCTPLQPIARLWEAWLETA